MISQPRVERVPNTVANQQALHARPWAIARSARPASRVAALTLLKWHRLLLLLRTGTRVAQQKTRRGYPPGLRHNSLGYHFVAEWRYTCQDTIAVGSVLIYRAHSNLIAPLVGSFASGYGVQLGHYLAVSVEFSRSYVLAPRSAIRDM